MIDFSCELVRASFDFDVSFRSSAGITALFGPSGSGKTTVVRLMAGLERPDRGRIAVGDAVLLDSAAGIDVPKHRRRIGVVFQDGLLLPHVSVATNLAYGRWFTPPAERRIDFQAVVAVLGIDHLLSRRPATLSGGEKQRVAIGRALLASPRLLLMDEPLASLDTPRKLEILPFIERLRDEFRIPIVYVSHSVEEVARLAGFVVKLDGGRVVAAGTPADVLSAAAFADPADRFDVLSILTGTVDRYLPDHQVTTIDHPAGAIVVPGRLGMRGDATTVLIRATNVALATGRPGDVSIRTVLDGRIAALQRDDGPFVLATITLKGGAALKAYVTRLACDAMPLQVGMDVSALVKTVSIDERGVGAQRQAP